MIPTLSSQLILNKSVDCEPGCGLAVSIAPGKPTSMGQRHHAGKETSHE